MFLRSVRLLGSGVRPRTQTELISHLSIIRQPAYHVSISTDLGARLCVSAFRRICPPVTQQQASPSLQRRTFIVISCELFTSARTIFFQRTHHSTRRNLMRRATA